MKPSVVRHRSLLQLSYLLPSRLFACRAYPVRSPNGSRIVVCATVEGLRIIWYGGRPFKDSKPDEASEKVNGSSGNEPMVIDLSDDEAEPSPTAPKLADFEDEEAEVDPAAPYHPILRYIDVPLGTNATHVAVPNMPVTAAGELSDSYAPLLSSQIVVAVACADLSIRLVRLPLAPPSSSSVEYSEWNIQAVKISGSNTHQDLISSISLTDVAESSDVDGEADQSKSRSRTRATNASTGKQWSFIIASTSCTGSGLLLLHRIPILETNVFSDTSEFLFPFQRQYLRSSLSSCTLAFNPCPNSAERSSNLLITLPDSGCVKIYQVLPNTSQPRGRRGSAATIDSTASSSGQMRGPPAQQGKFLISLYPGFISPNESHPMGRRQRPLDSSWVLGGRAVLVLLENGEWGIWDLEAAGPSSSSSTQNLVKGQSSVSGIQGGPMTRFAIRGTTSQSVDTLGKLSADKQPLSKAAGLAPMTPHTRKIRSDGLFRGSPSASTPLSGTAYLQGSISVSEVTSLSKSADESVILTYGNVSNYIPSLLALWNAKTTGRGSFDTSNTGRQTTIPTVRLGGEQLRTICQFPVNSKLSANRFGLTQHLPEIFVTTEHQIILLVNPLAEAAAQETEPSRRISARFPGAKTSSDELLLDRGELDIDGMDRVLNDMSNGHGIKLGTSVGSALDEDIDMVMSLGTPTPKNHGKQTRPVRGTPSTRREQPKGLMFN